MPADLIEAAIDMLYSYRRNCATNSSPGQLILPESLKLLPLYLSAMTKLAAFTVNKPSGSTKPAFPMQGQQQQAPVQQLLGPGRPVLSTAGGQFAEVSARVDARATELSLLSSLPAARLVPYMYPKMYRVDMLAPQHGVCIPPDYPQDAPPPPPQPAHTLTREQLVHVVLPQVVYPSAEQLAPHATYLLDHRTGLFLIVGSDMDEDMFREFFGSMPGVLSPSELPPSTPLPQLDTEGSTRLWSIITAIRARRQPYLPVIVVASSDAPLREHLMSIMAEDRVGGSRSYVDLLCHVHSAIQQKLTAGQ